MLTASRVSDTRAARHSKPSHPHVPGPAGADFKWRELAQESAECRGGQLRYPTNRRPRIEPRQRSRRGAPCAKPPTLIAGKPGQRFEMVVSFHKKQRHLPVVELKRAA
ncbi:MAG: hypothetical protein IH899_14965 [Planctomycetes bacterium]|nr:hypothetical protein [Planctomycetota bacterium]